MTNFNTKNVHILLAHFPFLEKQESIRTAMSRCARLPLPQPPPLPHHERALGGGSRATGHAIKSMLSLSAFLM